MRPRVTRPTVLEVPETRYAPAAARSASWYLDPVVARQKAAVFLGLVERWRDPTATGPVLKTDLFEEANGEDALVPGLENCVSLVGLDLDLDTARQAKRRFAGANLAVVVTDMRRLGVRDSVFDLVVSPSTLDHFETRDELETALLEIRRVLRPGGTAILIFDNPANPLYHALRWITPLVTSYSLGHTMGRLRLSETLETLGFDVLGHQYVIHNPRGILTLVNLLLRRVLGRFAERPIDGLVRAFARLDRLPTRALSASFVAVGARKRAPQTTPPADLR